MERELNMVIVSDNNSIESREILAELRKIELPITHTVLTPASVKNILPIRANPAVGIILWATDLEGIVSDVEAFAKYLKGEVDVKAAAHEAQLYIPDIVAANQPDILVDPWDGNGVGYVKGELVRYENKTYRCVNPHTSQSDWMPDVSPSLWVHLNYRDGYRVIPASIEATAAFSKGERGWWGNILYESLADANVYTPEQYAANWQEVVTE